MSVSKPDGVSDLLRRKILSGDIGAGERINVRALESDLGVSHIPIREAIRRLEAEGLIERRPNTGVVASQVSLGQLDELYEFRRLIEPALGCRSVPRMTEAHVVGIFETLDRMEAAAILPDGLDDYVKFHREFHWRLLEPGASTLIERTLDDLWQRSERYLRLLKGRVTPIADAEHELMAEACREGDADRLRDLLETHLELTGKALREMLYGGDSSGFGNELLAHASGDDGSEPGRADA